MYIHSGVRRSEIQTTSATARHGIPNHLAPRVFHCGYNIFLVKILKCMLWGINCCMRHSSESNSLFHSAKVQWRWRLTKSSLLFSITGVRCGFRANSVQILYRDVSKQCWNLLRKIARIFLQELFGQRITFCLIERSTLGLSSVDDQTVSCHEMCHQHWIWR